MIQNHPLDFPKTQIIMKPIHVGLLGIGTVGGGTF